MICLGCHVWLFESIHNWQDSVEPSVDNFVVNFFNKKNKKSRSL